MRRSASAAIAGLATAALATTGVLTGPGAIAAPADPDEGNKQLSGLLGNGNQHDIDRRRGDVAPTATQRAADRRTPAQVRWNQYGTPATVSATQAIARRLPAKPEDAARSYLRQNQELFGLDATAVDSLETLAAVPVGDGTIVTMRQRIGGLPTTQGGLVTVAMRGGAVLHVSSSLTRDTGGLAAPELDKAAARRRAIEAAGLEADSTNILRTRRVAVPTPDGTHPAYEVVLSETGGHGSAYTVLIEATTGDLLVREDLVDSLEDNPTWEVFGSTPSLKGDRTRETWCWIAVAGCEDAVDSGASPLPWDVDPATGEPTNTTQGNNAYSGKAWDLPPWLPMVDRTALPRADRDYDYSFDDIWYDTKCDPAALTGDTGNDIDAATANLFAHHNRLHDFSYHLGFTEQTWNAQQSNFGLGEGEADPEIGKAQSGARLGFRDNANQYTTPDGIPPWSNMYLWQPIAGGAYPPCVDGDFDATVIGHEYTHLITNRMVAGPDEGLRGLQGGAMGESWSDLVAMEYLFELGKRPVGDTPYVTGAYVTGDEVAGIRNYDMSRSPLNYSDVGYDVVGLGVHQDGEIWSATNFTVRQAFIDRYGEGDADLQRSCADGDTAAEDCPGNRKWVQLLFDSLLVPATGEVSMVDMRDAMLVADELRFDGANQALIWGAFAQRGVGEDASSTGTNDTDPQPSFSSPYADNANVRFGVPGRIGAPVTIYIGDYEKGVMPVADTDPASEMDDRVEMVPGTYDALAVGPTVGHHRFSFEVKANQQRTVPVKVTENVAAAANGATATGDGVDAAELLDATESTDWEAEAEDIEGLGVTVDLAGDKAQQVRRVNVSAFYESGSRFSALRQFEVLACDASSGVDCSDTDEFEQVYLSPADAFPGNGFRPTAPDLNVRSFTIPKTRATHLRLEVVTNQCTGGPEFQGDLDNDPGNITDCPTGAPSVAQVVRAAEFQAYRK